MLLLLTAGYSSACRVLEERLATDVDAHAVIARAFVPVRVDVDWRPDIADRYGLEAWPTLLALSPEGLVLGGGTGPQVQLAPWLERAATLFARHDGSLPQPAVEARAPMPPPLDAEALTEAWEQLSRAVDEERQAFGAPGQPDLAPALAGIAGAAVGVSVFAEIAARTVDLLLASPRWVPERGVLLLRGATAWTPAEDVARLDVQAEWVRLLAHGVSANPARGWAQALDTAVGGLQTAFRAAAVPWTPWTGGPPVLFVDGCARACRGLLTAAAVRERPEWAEQAIDTLEAVLPRVYTKGAGLAHALTTRPHGPTLLTDSVLAAHALLDADPWRAQPVYHDLAEELILSSVVRLSHASGALCDRRHTMAGANDVGRLADPLCPLEGNAEAARLCLRLGGSDRAAWGARARGLLVGVHHDVRLAGGFAAPAALAWAALAAPDDAIPIW